jgi:hypothetical protein
VTKIVWKLAFTTGIVLLSTGIIFAQEKQDPPEVLAKQTDGKEVLSSLFSKKKIRQRYLAKKTFHYIHAPLRGF